SENFKPGEVYRLKKSLYGLKQSPRAWFGRKKYILDLLAETRMLDCKPAETPMMSNQKLYMETKAELADRDRGSRGYNWAKTQENKCFQFLNDNTTLSSVPTLKNNLAGDFSHVGKNEMKQQEKIKRRLNARIIYAMVRTVGNDEILRFAKLFNDQLTLRYISRPRLVNMCSRIKNDDKMIQSKGGVDARSEDELREDCNVIGWIYLLITPFHLRS
nr:hypothetical protein [Tanacetum cinerariifolium]